MQIKQLIADLPAILVEGALDREVLGVAYDSRRVTPGMVFVAVPGLKTDGHSYIENAIERGAVAVVCERNGFISQRAAKIKVKDTREALARLSAVFYQRPSARLKVIGITGTNGKTTVAFMVKQILERAGIKTGLMGTIRYEIGERVIPAHRTTPESLDIQQMMAQMLRADCQACVMEVSSHALEQKRVMEIDFDAIIFTNLTQDHLDFHGNMETYYLAKKKLFAQWPNHDKPRTALINIDDAFGQRLLVESDAEVKLSYGIDQTAQIRATHIQLGRQETQMEIQTPQKSLPCRLPLLGRHNVYNALAAFGAARALDVPCKTIIKALESMQPVPGRLELVPGSQPFTVLVDYAHTDDALRNVLTALKEITVGRVLLVFGCGGNRDSGKRPKMGRVAAELADYSVITSDNPRKESAATIASQIQEGYWKVRQDGCHMELDRHRAIDETIRLAKPGDTVLIAGKGHETCQEFEDTIVPFDDRVFALETLETLGYAAPAKAGRK
jgi:UDP-N-acetylmuramoyl-L-alanyl-D-glutamate--2,6-diaminopimelate ligase